MQISNINEGGIDIDFLEELTLDYWHWIEDFPIIVTDIETCQWLYATIDIEVRTIE